MVRLPFLNSLGLWNDRGTAVRPNFLVREAQALGVEYVDRVALGGVRWEPGGERWQHQNHRPCNPYSRPPVILPVQDSLRGTRNRRLA